MARHSGAWVGGHSIVRVEIAGCRKTWLVVSGRDAQLSLSPILENNRISGQPALVPAEASQRTFVNTPLRAQPQRR